MALQSETQIYIGGQSINAFKQLNLIQSIDSHHILEVRCRMDVIEKLTAELASESKNFLGQTISIQITSVDSLSGYENFEFKGIVTAVKNVKGFSYASGDEVLITAQSPTFLAEDGPHYASYNDVSISEIIEKTFRDYDKSKLQVEIMPMNDVSIHYSVQHNESAFHYASRLAAQYGEWLYYDGQKLVFGEPGEKELKLTYNIDLKEYHLTLLPQAQNYKFFTNDYLVDEIHQKDAKEYTSGAGGFNAFVANKASEIFNKETAVYHSLYNDPATKERFESGIELQKKSIEINQVKLTGISDNPGVRIGNIVTIEEGRYRIVNVVHTTNEVGDYQNQFEAITAAYNAYPNTNISAYPKSQNQTAVVVDNIDPEGIGRIQVQFPWQVLTAEKTPWIRIMTPHAGDDKGFHFIPELGEEVLIGFEGGNAERPFMMGSLYHGKAKPISWKTNKNDIKAIRTRSGHTIEFNDAEGSESILITDINSNKIYIDTANNNITISANETMTLNSKNMNINVEEDMNITVGKNKTDNVTEKITITAENENKQIGEEIKVLSGTYVQEAQEISVDSSGKITTNAGGKIVIASADTVEYAE